LSDQNKQETINVSNLGKDDRKLFDIMISLQSKPDDKNLIEITMKQDFNNLLQRIRETFEMMNDDLKGLQGLRVKSLTKKAEENANLTEYQLNLAHEAQLMVAINFENRDDLVQKQLAPNDRVFVEFESQDLWLKVLLKMNSAGDRSFESEFEIKIDLNTTGEHLKAVI
jgi:hypothetical protein